MTSSGGGWDPLEAGPATSRQFIVGASGWVGKLAQVHLRVEHTTRYRYETPAWDSFNELRLRPADDYRQTLLAFDLRTDPPTELRSQRDQHGTLTHQFHLAARHSELTVTASSLVETYAVPIPIPVSASTLPNLRHRFFTYLAPTKRVPLDLDWFQLLGALPLAPGQNLANYLDELTAYLRTRFRYLPNATNVDTPLAEFVAAGAGVCQDYTHAMLALCRQAGIPARYVSGYVHANPSGELQLLGSEGSHAWVEAFLPGNGWVGFDPTNGRPVEEAYVKIGVGTDYDDVPPVWGLRRGGGHGQMEVEVSVRLEAGESGSPAEMAWATADEA